MHHHVTIILDIDECGMNGLNSCNDDSTTCSNAEGSYMCECIAGFQRVNVFSCTGISLVLVKLPWKQTRCA